MKLKSWSIGHGHFYGRWYCMVMCHVFHSIHSRSPSFSHPYFIMHSGFLFLGSEKEMSFVIRIDTQIQNDFISLVVSWLDCTQDDGVLFLFISMFYFWVFTFCFSWFIVQKYEELLRSNLSFWKRSRKLFLNKELVIKCLCFFVILTRPQCLNSFSFAVLPIKEKEVYNVSTTTGYPF